MREEKLSYVEILLIKVAKKEKENLQSSSEKCYLHYREDGEITTMLLVGL